MRTIGIIAETEQYRNRQDAGEMSNVEEADFFALLEHYCDPSLPHLDAAHSQVLIGVLTQAHFHSHGEEPIDLFNRPLFAGFSAPHLYTENKTAAAMQEDPATLFRQATTFEDRSAVVVAGFKTKLARALDITADEVDSRRSLSDYGTDSLMALELRNWIRRDFGVLVTIFDITGGANIAAVSKLIAEKGEN